MEVKMLSRKMVKPANPTPKNLLTSELSFFDQMQPPVYIPTIYFFQSGSTSRRRLEASLSETLIRFYPLAGRFSIDGSCVNCNDQGVDYLEAEALDVTLAELLDNASTNLELLHCLVPWDIQKPKMDISPIVGIQLTTFKCGGLVICGLCSHIKLDGFSGSTFFREWSIACRAGLDEAMLPNFCIPSIFPKRDLSGMIKPSGSPFLRNIKMVTRRFVFPQKTILNLKSEVRASTGNVVNPSRVEVLACTLWKVLISIDQAKHGSLRDSTLCTSVNLRGRTGIKDIPQNVFGNFYFQIPIRFKRGNGTKPENLELHHLVSLFSKTIKNEIGECSKISDPNELMTKVAKNINIIREEKGNDGVNFRFFNTLCNFPMYDVDFGWGKPEWVGVTSVPVELVVLMDSKCGTKVEATVSLTETDMHGFQNHPDIVALTSLME
ncbi:acetyl-CoA-benzylalcohol acetyltransferase-like [Apium graveolens]|uniref:acetyl-CoA-benzylalcohol acetyltransferase-like n=1 Tax=Apium graveolens TaxID=4045 RepID=UPI003D7A7C1F